MALILTGFALIALIDLWPIMRHYRGRTAVTFFLLFIPALVLAVLQAAGVEVPSLLVALGDALKSLGISY
ncbi:MAG: hypothetical protein ACOX88_07075 [Christensenellales bacterium]|jgi:hypothetical protein